MTAERVYGAGLSREKRERIDKERAARLRLRELLTAAHADPDATSPNGQARPIDFTREIADAGNYQAVITELLGYVGQAIDDETMIEPRGLYEYIRELKRTHVSDPIRTRLREIQAENIAAALWPTP